MSRLTGAGSLNTLIASAISGGKDSFCCAIEIDNFLKSIDFRGEFILIHSDLGLIEHAESLAECRRLAKHIGRELVIVHPTRPMLERWEFRWESSVDRFINLERVKLVAPWSGPGAMRFCTSDEKVTPITQELKNRYPGKFIINAVGLRRDESKERAKKKLWKVNDKLSGVKLQTSGIDWHPILDYTAAEVFEIHDRENFEPHPAYARGNSRVSCSFCVLSSTGDLEVSLRDTRNSESFRRIINLEFESTYSFRNKSFLAEVGFDYLTEREKEQFAAAREKQIKRLMIEKEIPKNLLYVENFPAFQPDIFQAGQLGEIRARIGELFGFEMKFTSAQEVYNRYAELIVKREKRDEEKRKKAEREKTKALKQEKTSEQKKLKQSKPSQISKKVIAELKQSILAEQDSFEQMPLF